MTKRGHSEEQILRVLRGGRSRGRRWWGLPKHGISQQSFNLWKKKFIAAWRNRLLGPLIASD